MYFSSNGLNDDYSTTSRNDSIKVYDVQQDREISLRPLQEVTTLASRLRDFTRINPPTLYGSKVDEDPEKFIDEVYKIL